MERLVLFDIDCTLIDGHGAGKRAVVRALRDVYGVEGDLGEYSFHGRTDPVIVRELVALWSREGAVELDIPAVEDRLQTCLARYVELLRGEIARGRVEVLPGVKELVAALAADQRAVLGLLTGNVEGGARIKLASTGLLPHFKIAVYGTDALTRPGLPAIAVQHAETLTGKRFTGKEIVIIGDTPADIACGAHLGVRTIAVATGRYTSAELSRHAPDRVFDNLSDWRAACSAIFA